MVTVSTMFVLLSVFVPHHHHDGKTCVVMEFSLQDHQKNDDHTGHSNVPDNRNQGENCVAESVYTAPKANEENLCAGSCDHPDHSHFIPLYYLLAEFLIYTSEESSSATEYGEYISFYQSAEANHFHGLRAPPFPLS